MRVQNPSGEEWHVRLQWLPRYEGRGLRERLRRRRARSRHRRDDDRSRWFDFIDLAIVDDSLTGIVVSILAIIGVVLMLTVGLPFLLATFDLVLVLLVAGLSLLGRVVFRRPWIVEATSEGQRVEIPVVGWRAARREQAEIANQIVHGHDPDRGGPASMRAMSSGTDAR